MQYIGESLIYGEIGKGLIALSFVAALLSVIGYLNATFQKQTSHPWQLLGRASFAVHGISIFGIFALLIYIIFNHYFEYYYVWFHSSTDMPQQYIFACIWEGQEGSFLLWTFWHVILSLVIIFCSRDWEAPVMSVIMMVQVFLCSMFLGIYIGDFHVGSNPFILLREHPEMFDKPFVQSATYLEGIIKQGGRGLNPLLQNYWMTIHPPTLFLGFAATVIPFAFALSGLITGRVKEWIKPALPYTYFGIMILGTGILMGAAWAYEALSFGGFWAWDPVENASLIPWITLVAAGHVMIITHRTSRALPSSLFLSIITFLLILYSTFLTRSGILGETSVHAFTDLGMSGQLILYMAFFTLLGIGFFIYYRKSIYNKLPEEDILSREFWIFIGVLALSISAIQIIITTSIPVFNKITGLKYAPPVDVIDHYNKWQTPIAAIICLLIAVGQHFKWTHNDAKYLFKKLWLPFLISAIVAAIYQWQIQLPRIQHTLLLFCALFAVAANIDFLITTLKGRIKFGGASIAHVGIGLILIGALVSNAARKTISENRLKVNLGKDFPNTENIMLLKNDTLRMDKYYVSYTGKEKIDKNIFYNIDYFTLEGSQGGFIKKFSLKPFVQLNERMGNVAEPATKHYWNKDIYTFVQYAEIDKDKNNGNDEYNKPTDIKLQKGDTFSTSNSLMILEDIFSQKNEDNNLIIKAQFRAIDINNKEYTVSPEYKIIGMNAYSDDKELKELGLRVSFTGVLPKENKLEFKVAEKKSNSREFIIMKAMIFPHINILWLGCLFMVIGSWVAIIQRIKLNKRITPNHNNHDHKPDKAAPTELIETPAPANI